MSIRISLSFDVRWSRSLLAQSIRVRIIRLIGHVRFWTGSGWTADEPAIFDTGSPVSLLPYSLCSLRSPTTSSYGQGIEAEILSNEVSLRGLAPQARAVVTGRLAEIIASFRDDQNISPPLIMRTYLLNTDRVPLLIGFEDVLTECKLFSNFPDDIAYIEFAHDFNNETLFIYSDGEKPERNQYYVNTEHFS